MNLKLFTALLLALSVEVKAAELSNLAVSAAALKSAAAAGPLAAAPELSESFSAAGRNDDRWYGADSRRARMRFTAYMLYKVPASYKGPVSQLLSDPELEQAVSELIDLQLQHMYGAFTTHPGFVDNPGIPSGDYKVEITDVEKVPNERYARITYSYDDIVVFSKKLFQGGGATRINFVLPLDPVTIYRRGFPAAGSRKNRCTDDHYNSEGDFWYFWNPYQEGCPIGGEDLVAVQTDLTPLPMTRATYPEYARLGTEELLQVSYIVGVDENFQSGDLGKRTFKDAFAGLQAAGFRATVDEPRRKRLTFRSGAKRTAVEMRLMDPNSVEFARETVRGLKTSDVFLYDGHSGLGGYLDPGRLMEDSGAKLTLPKDKYQIFIFQGCSTYAYYNTAFFKLKRSATDHKGTRNLDIVTTGIGAEFSVGAKVDVALLSNITMGARPTWQTILNKVRAAEGDASALSHVNGDEDNPNTPD